MHLEKQPGLLKKALFREIRCRDMFTATHFSFNYTLDAVIGIDSHGKVIEWAITKPKSKALRGAG